MGSVPTQRVVAYLNGPDEVPVEITDFLADQQSLQYRWGRTDWSSDAPNAGVLSLVLDNRDGRFTPGNTAVYKVGCVDGVAVAWLCNETRQRAFWMGTPKPSFPSGSAASSLVSVDCYDGVGVAARRTLRSMLDEEVLAAGPVAYWRLDESGSGTSVQPADSSGNAAAPLAVTGPAAAFGWAEGQGPAADTGGALHLWGDTESAPVDAALQTLRKLPMLPFWTAAGTETRWAVMLWFTIKPGVYKSTDAAVHLLSVLFDPHQLAVWWDPATSRLSVVGDGEAVPGAAQVPCSTNATHCLVLAGRGTYSPSATPWSMVSVTLDGLAGPGVVDARYNAAPVGVRLGAPDRSVWASGSAHAGTVARVAIWGADAVGAVDPAWDGAPTFPASAQFWPVGQFGAPERPAARAARLAAYAGLSVSAQGTDRGDVVGRQDTDGQTLLAALCDALRTEDAAVTGGLQPTVLVPWLYSTQRDPADAGLTVDAESDADGPPDMSFDTSAVASTVTVTSPSVQATWRSPDPGRWSDQAVQLSCALVDAGAAENLAQYRTLLGRISSPVPATLVVDAATCEADILDGLLALRPGSAVQVTGLPVTATATDTPAMYVVGVTETHGTDQARFEMVLQPARDLGPEWQLFDPGVANYNTGRLQASDGNVLGKACTATDTTIYVAQPADSLLATVAVAGNYVLRVGAEMMTVTSVLANGSVTVIRGALGTTAVAHDLFERVYIAAKSIIEY